ncbi:MAG: hypothetical protein ACI81A_001627, partial [Paraglaciecola sp.]
MSLRKPESNDWYKATALLAVITPIGSHVSPTVLHLLHARLCSEFLCA